MKTFGSVGRWTEDRMDLRVKAVEGKKRSDEARNELMPVVRTPITSIFHFWQPYPTSALFRILSSRGPPYSPLLSRSIGKDTFFDDEWFWQKHQTPDVIGHRAKMYRFVSFILSGPLVNKTVGLYIYTPVMIILA